MTRAPNTCRHDTQALPQGGFYFAPGTIEQAGRRQLRTGPLVRLALQATAVLALVGLLAFAVGVLHAKGWPL